MFGLFDDKDYLTLWSHRAANLGGELGQGSAASDLLVKLGQLAGDNGPSIAQYIRTISQRFGRAMAES